MKIIAQTETTVTVTIQGTAHEMENLANWLERHISHENTELRGTPVITNVENLTRTLLVETA